MSDSRKNGYLSDIGSSIALIEQSVSGHDFDSYKQNQLVRSAVERQLMIIGESVTQLSRLFPDTAKKLGDISVIVAFRNRLVHGYSTVDHAIVWGVIQDDLPMLKQCASTVLNQN